MLKDYLDKKIYDLIVKNFNFNDITEIRMRVNENLIVALNMRKFFLKDDENNFVVCDKNMIDDFITKCSENSLYAFNESLKQGFLTLKNGIRVGVAGYVVKDDKRIVTLKDIQAVNVRIPHFVKNCSLNSFDYIVGDRVKNTLIISAPGAGKTTYIRDLIYQMSKHNQSKNVLLVDERNEISSCNDGSPIFDLGNFCDIYTNCDKRFAFTNGIRSMAPDVIVTDEINLDKDLDVIVDAMNSGVSVIATIHAMDIDELKRKPQFEKVLEKKYFERFVVLSKDNGVGTLNYIFDENLKVIYCRS